MEKEEIIGKLKKYVQEVCKNDYTGHEKKWYTKSSITQYTCLPFRCWHTADRRKRSRSMKFRFEKNISIEESRLFW